MAALALKGNKIKTGKKKKLKKSLHPGGLARKRELLAHKLGKHVLGNHAPSAELHVRDAVPVKAPLKRIPLYADAL